MCSEAAACPAVEGFVLLSGCLCLGMTSPSEICIADSAHHLAIPSLSSFVFPCKGSTVLQQQPLPVIPYANTSAGDTTYAAQSFITTLKQRSIQTFGLFFSPDAACLGLVLRLDLPAGLHGHEPILA
eukprot:1161719-Pelagomonas_calceolata.AAC.2